MGLLQIETGSLGFIVSLTFLRHRGLILLLSVLRFSNESCFVNIEGNYMKTLKLCLIKMMNGQVEVGRNWWTIQLLLP